jgi:flagellar basal body-associated protein FliL
MQIEARNENEAMQRFSRRSLWMALTLMGLLACFALSTFVDASMSRLAGALLPIAVVMAIVVLGRRPGSKQARQAVQQDELRQQSMGLAQRDALIAVLVAQPLFAVAAVEFPQPSPTALMACMTVLIGAIVLITSLLCRDR